MEIVTENTKVVFSFSNQEGVIYSLMNTRTTNQFTKAAWVGISIQHFLLRNKT